jgi:uncharacterized protein YodC (DUF2158 family)
MSETKIVSLVKPAEPPGPFSRGDCVKLRGGRVKMTVKSASRAKVTAVWHDVGEEPARAGEDEGEGG